MHIWGVDRGKPKLWGKRRFAGFAKLLAVFAISLMSSDLQNVIPNAIAADSTAGFLPASLFQTTPSASWDASKGMTMATILSSCNAPIQTSIMGFQSAMTGMMGGPGAAQSQPSCPLAMGITIETPCPLEDQAVSSSTLSCQNYNDGLAAQLLGQYSQAYCSAACKSAKLAACRQEMSCIQGLANQLNMQAKSVGEMFQKNILLMQEQVRAYKLAIADRQAQIQDVNMKLKGDPASGTPGLLALKESTDRMIAMMPQEIQQVRQRQQSIEQWQKSLDGQVQMKTMSDAMKCFNTQPMSGYKCSTNDKTARSGRDALMCSFEAYDQKGTNGGVERNETTKTQAESKSAQLKALLDEMTASAPADVDIPTNAQDVGKMNKQARLVLSVADAKSRFYDRLSKFKIDNKNAADVVMGLLGYCYGNASKTMARDKKDGNNTAVGQAQFNINSEKAAILDSMKPLFQKYRRQMTEITSGLIGSDSLTLPTCDKGTAQVQMNCLENYRQNLTATFYGTGGKANVQLEIKGSDPRTYFKFNCQGLSGCVTNLQNISRNVTLDMKKLESDKQNFIGASNKATQEYAMQVAKQLSAPSQMLSQRLAMLKSAAESLGGNMPNAMMTMPGQAPQFDEDKLMKPPADPLGFIGQFVTPALPAANAMSMSLPSNINSLPRILEEYGKVANMKQQCAYQNITDAVERAGGMSASNCHQSRYCQDSQIDKLTQTVNRATGGSGIPGSATSLMSGVAAACEPPSIGQAPNMKDYGTDKEGYRLAMRDYRDDMRYSGANPQGCAAFFGSVLSATKVIEINAPALRGGGRSATGR